MNCMKNEKTGLVLEGGLAHLEHMRSWLEE